jgi:hypothetical protein
MACPPQKSKEGGVEAVHSTPPSLLCVYVPKQATNSLNGLILRSAKAFDPDRLSPVGTKKSPQTLHLKMRRLRAFGA